MYVCGTNSDRPLVSCPVDINSHQPAAISGNSKSNIAPLTSLIPLCSVQVGVTANRGSPTAPRLCPICTGAVTPTCVARAVQIYSDIPPTASVDIIKRSLLGEQKNKKKPLGQMYLHGDLSPSRQSRRPAALVFARLQTVSGGRV